MTRTGTIKMNGSVVGYVEEIITINHQLMQAKLDQGDIVPAFDEEILSGRAGDHDDRSSNEQTEPRLGHAKGFHPKGVEEKTPRLGHKHGFHPKGTGEQVSGGDYGNTGGRSEANYLGSTRSRMAGVESGPNQNLTTVQTKAGPITVNKTASSDMVGAVNDLVEAGAPVGHIGSHADRNIRGSGRKSQHAFGGAMDLFNQSGKGIISKQGMDWIKANPDKWRDIKAKHNLVGGEEFGDIGHVEWGGPGYGERHYGGKDAPKATPKTGSVKGSWFDDKSTATGLSAASMPGIALPSREGLGKLYEVTGPNGQKALLRQIDIGPHERTGRGVDISKPALEKLGYTTKNFPTDADFHVTPAPKMPTQTEPM